VNGDIIYRMEHAYKAITIAMKSNLIAMQHVLELAQADFLIRLSMIVLLTAQLDILQILLLLYVFKLVQLPFIMATPLLKLVFWAVLFHTLEIQNQECALLIVLLIISVMRVPIFALHLALTINLEIQAINFVLTIAR